LRYSPEDCIKAGFSADFITKVINRIRQNQFKRVLPPIAKLSNRTVEYDFFNAQDWGT
jgi:NAD+ synthase